MRAGLVLEPGRYAASGIDACSFTPSRSSFARWNWSSACFRLADWQRRYLIGVGVAASLPLDQRLLNHLMQQSLELGRDRIGRVAAAVPSKRQYHP